MVVAVETSSLTPTSTTSELFHLLVKRVNFVTKQASGSHYIEIMHLDV